MNESKRIAIRQERRRNAVRRKIGRTATRPRLSVNRSCKHISAQVIDDRDGRTLCAATTTAKALAGDLSGKTKSERAAVIGREIARKAIEAGVSAVVFDRGASSYHGRIKALADAAREGGLKF
jgi:large subunit ribosomal protein L18